MNLKEVLISDRIISARRAFGPAFQTYTINRNDALKKVNERSLKERLREIKKYSIENLEHLKKQAVQNLEAQGIKVFEARNAREAREIIKRIIPAGELVVKSKSNTINEIELVKHIKKRNKIIETDCGDFLVQVCEEEGTHPVTPALHIPIEEMVERINKKFKVRVEPTPEKIAEWVKGYLKSKILEAEFGLTGANAISADGSIVILENEGNISLVTRLPEKHIVVAGIEKIVPRLEDAMLVCQASAIWGTGASWPAYINVISSASKTADIQKKTVWGMHGAKEVILIFLDNGRSEAIKNGFQESLYCINCGSCLYFCPVYRQIFDNYGLHYLSGIGISRIAFTNGLQTAFERGLYYCTACTACKENCPLEIDVPGLVRKVRETAVKKKMETKANRKMIENIKRAGNPFGEIKEGETPKELYCC